MTYRVPSSPCASIPVPSSNSEPLVLFHRCWAHNSPPPFRPSLPQADSGLLSYCKSLKRQKWQIIQCPYTQKSCQSRGSCFMPQLPRFSVNAGPRCTVRPTRGSVQPVFSLPSRAALLPPPYTTQAKNALHYAELGINTYPEPTPDWFDLSVVCLTLGALPSSSPRRKGATYPSGASHGTGGVGDLPFNQSRQVVASC